MSLLIKIASNRRCTTHRVGFKLRANRRLYNTQILGSKIFGGKRIDEVVKELHGIGRSLGVGLAP